MKLLSCAFNFDTGRVELLFDDEFPFKGVACCF